MDQGINQNKIDSDLLFLKKLIVFAGECLWRVVVSGGYGMDFFLNKITRTHGDLDVIIYGKEPRGMVTKKLNQFVLHAFPNATVIIKDEMFYLEMDVKAKNFVANIYFVETVEDPYLNLNKVRKQSGEIITNGINSFPLPVPGKIGDFEVEVQDQNAHLADILTRRGYDKSLSKHDLDILKLTKVTDPKKVESLLKNK